MATKELLSTITVGAGGVASITFSSFPNDGTDLLVVCSARDTTTNGLAYVVLNADSTASNYERRMLFSNGTSTSSTSSTNIPFFHIVNSSQTASTFGSAQVLIPDYAGSAAKTISIQAITEGSSTTGYANLVSGNWTGTAAVTSVTLTKNGTGLFVEGSTATLYKITKGSGGASVA